MQAVATKQQTIDLNVIKADIAAKIDVNGFSCWVAPLSFSIVDNTLVLSAQNQFSADYVNSVYLNVIKNVVAGYGLNVRICVKNISNKPVNDNKQIEYVAPTNNNVLETSDFDSFVVCSENKFVVSACQKLASGTATFSPLFIYGPAGCGKSLLANCINTAARGRTVMMTGGQFVAEFTRALHDKKIFAFKDYCRNCDTFILDDVQVLSGKRATCEEFLQLIVDLRNAGKSIVLTAPYAPSNLSGFDHHAQSVFASGLVADIVAPNNDVKRVMFSRAGVSKSVADDLVGRIASDGHLVAGVLNKIKTYSELMGTSVDLATAQHLLSDTLQKTKTPMTMVKSMCEKLGVSYDAVCGTGRGRALVLARQMMMAVLKNVTNLSLSEIGQMVGDRDHATVLYAIEKIENLKKTDLVLSAQIAQLIAEYK